MARTLIYASKVTMNSDAFVRRVIEIASDLSMQPDWLMIVMGFETAYTYSPTIKNPNSTAIGLIQFLSSTAKELGTSTEELSRMSNVQQLDYVRKYYQLQISRYGTIDNVADAYLAVFYPAAIKYGLDEALPAGIVRSNPAFDLNSDGVIQKQEIIDKILSTVPAGYQHTVGEKKTL